jgi:hypothetical protein
VTLLVPDSVAVRRVRQGTLSGATFKRIKKKSRKHYLRTDLRTLKVQCFQIEGELIGSCSNHWWDEECLQEFGLKI